MEDAAASITGTDGYFEVETVQGQTYRSKKLLFAVGMKDLQVDIKGLADVYGKCAFICPYCDGWELREQPLVLIVKGADALHMAKMISGWTKQITICTNGPEELTDAHREVLNQHNIPVYDSPIQSVESNDGMVHQVVLEDGTSIQCSGIFFRPKLITGSDLPQAIGCQITEAGTVIVDNFGKTNVPGVFSAGDAASQLHQSIIAASLGSLAGVGINNELNEEAWNNQE